MRPPPATPVIHVGGFRIGRHGRFWSVSDSQDQLVCLAVYKKGALEVVRRLLPPDLRHLADGVPGRPAPDGKPPAATTRAASDKRPRAGRSVRLARLPRTLTSKRTDIPTN